MKNIFIIAFSGVSVVCLAQTKISFENKIDVEVARLEYAWNYPDTKVKLISDDFYKQILEKSFLAAFEKKWNITAGFKVTQNRLSSLRAKPMFNTAITSSDTTKGYIFLQLFDKAILNPCDSLSAEIDVKYRLIKAGVIIKDRLVSFKIFRRNPYPGNITIRRYSYHPSQFSYLCDTIAPTILNDENKDERAIWLNPACEYPPQSIQRDERVSKSEFMNGHRSIAVMGENGFSMILDSVNELKVGEYGHGIENTVALLTKSDFRKKRSTYYTADLSFTDESKIYHAYINYAYTKILESGRNQSAFRQIYSYTTHVITINGDTVSSFNIQFKRTLHRFDSIWDGLDRATVENISGSIQYTNVIEMEMRGTIDDNVPFVLTTSGEGEIKKATLNGEQMFSFYSNSGQYALMTYRTINQNQLKTLTLLCLLSDKYFNYHKI